VPSYVQSALPANILTGQKKIEGQGNGFLVGCAAMQSVEIRNAIG
jgi:hypothetical protein